MPRRTQDCPPTLLLLFSRGSRQVNDINTELNSLQSKIQSHNTAQAQASGLNRKAEDLDKEVRTLEGTLADYNIAQDKHRQGSDVNDLYK